MNNTRINKIIEALESQGLGSLADGLGMEMAPVLSKEMSQAGENRMIQLIVLMAKGYRKLNRRINWEIMREVVGRFLELAKGKKKDQIKNLFVSFTLVPVFNTAGGGSTWRGRKYKGLNSESKERENWGKQAAIEKYLGSMDLEQYGNYLNILRAAKRNSRK